MDSQGQEEAFNMEACWACDKIRLSHIESGFGKRCKQKKQPLSLAACGNF
jgi:hypothetical protein